MTSKEKYKLGMEMYINNKISLHKICSELKISRSRFSIFLRNNNIEIRSNKEIVNSSIFEKIDSEEKAYWLGFLYADGYVISNSNAIGIGLSEVDLSHLEKFKSFLGYKGKIRTKSKTKSCSIEFRDKKMKRDLIELGCIPRKSLVLTFPKENQVPKCFQKHFIRGYFDGDGSICITNKTRSVNLIGTYDFLKEVCNITKINCERIYRLDKDSTQFRIVLSSKSDILNFTRYIYKDSVLHLDRKHEKYIKLINA